MRRERPGPARCRWPSPERVPCAVRRVPCPVSRVPCAVSRVPCAGPVVPRGAAPAPAGTAASPGHWPPNPNSASKRAGEAAGPGALPSRGCPRHPQPARLAGNDRPCALALPKTGIPGQTAGLEKESLSSWQNPLRLKVCMVFCDPTAWGVLQLYCTNICFLFFTTSVPSPFSSFWPITEFLFLIARVMSSNTW